MASQDSVLLFEDSPPLFVPEIGLKVCFPAEAKPSESQQNLLIQLVSALKIRREKVQWIFYPGTKADAKEMIAKISPAGLGILFRPTGDENEEPLVHSEEGIFLIELPELQKIEGNLDLKKKVWAVLKPHVGA
jgi:hypothetical protein